MSPDSATPTLPPMPDVVSGEPRPPAAPRELRGDCPTPRRRNQRGHPPVPESEGPVLEWVQDTVWDQWKAVFFGFALVAALAFANTGWGWLTDLSDPGVQVIWAFFPIFGAVMWRLSRSHWCAAGASWVQHGKNWVSTYELTSIDFGIDGVKRVLRVADSSGREIRSLSLRDVQVNAKLWDLTYNGILHSLHSGKCEISPRALAVLKLENTVPASAVPARVRRPYFAIGFWIGAIALASFLIYSFVSDSDAPSQMLPIGVFIVVLALWASRRTIEQYRRDVRMAERMSSSRR